MELTKQKNYQQAFDLACASLRGMNPEERAEKAGGIYRKEAQEKIILVFLSGAYHITFPQFEFHAPGKKSVSLVTRNLLLHYLLRADGTPVTGTWRSYRDLPGGLLYTGVFARRVTDPMARKFGRSAKALMEVAGKLEATSGGVGDASLIVRVLPRIPVEVVLWEGDEEFPAHVQFLFDASVDHYLPLEDMVVLGQMVTARLIHSSPPSG